MDLKDTFYGYKGRMLYLSLFLWAAVILAWASWLYDLWRTFK